ncbi:MAG: SDR family NAD(P)-dependent oxidoreductase [Acidimicrobiia bacterium]
MDAPVVLVTGASSGTGLAAAVELAQRGARTYGTTRERPRAESLLVACERAGVAVEVIELDVRSAPSVRDAVGKVVAAEGRIDVLVNNAATVAFGPMEFTTVDDLHAMLETNLLGPIRMIQAVLPVMRRQGRGRIVNIGSVSAEPKVGVPGAAVYAATKAGMRALTIDLVKELEPLGIELVLCESGIGGRSAMLDSLAQGVSRFGQDDGAYSAVEDWTTAFGEFIEHNAPDSSGSGVLVANACLAPQPELRFPRAAQDLVNAAQRVSDDDYRRLCRGESLDAAVQELPTGFMWKLRSSSDL